MESIKEEGLVKFLSEIIEKQKISSLIEKSIIEDEYSKYRDALILWFKEKFKDKIHTVEDIDRLLDSMDEKEVEKIQEESEKDVTDMLYKNIFSKVNSIERDSKDLTAREFLFLLIILKHGILKHIKNPKDLDMKIGELLKKKEIEEDTGGMFA